MDDRALQLQRDGYLSEFDVRMARFLTSLCASDDPGFFMAAALVSRATAGGDVCLNLASVAGRSLPGTGSAGRPETYPALAAWLDTLAGSPAVGRPGQRRPLILDAAGRLYFFRYWEYERLLADAVQRRASEPRHVDIPLLARGIRRYFPAVTEGQTDWQVVACIGAVCHPFSVIAGGPGTGKTRTVARALAMLLEQAGGKRLRISLTAPTGKAAARLAASIRDAKIRMDCSEAVRSAVPDDAATIHRLLKPVPNTSSFRHDHDNPLPVDVVVVDEASMVDIALMSRLAQALPPAARLIIVGDMDQLASVEAGSVFGDICNRSQNPCFSRSFRDLIETLTGTRLEAKGPAVPDPAGLSDSIVALRKSYRFDDVGGIGPLSRAVNAGDCRAVFDILDDPSASRVGWREAGSGDVFHRSLANRVAGGYRDYLTAKDPRTAIERFDSFKILCVVKSGPFGVEALNGLARRLLAGSGLLPAPRAEREPWYPGRPVLVTRNDYGLGLFNGDMGITLPDPEGEPGELFVFFPGPSGQPRRFATYQMPAHETVFALTVHKSQGSEFDDVLIVLPDRDVPVLTRELIYTGLTRARRSVMIYAKREVLEKALTRTIDRTSGLRDRLWKKEK